MRRDRGREQRGYDRGEHPPRPDREALRERRSIPEYWLDYTRRRIKSAREELGEESASTAYSAGRTMTLEQAITYMLADEDP